MVYPAPDSGTALPAAHAEPSYAHARGDVPLPGYTLTEPLGRGGFGEVWACVAPGGLKKAVKFVSAGEDGDGVQFRQELAAFEQIKEIRHPFLLTLERVEVVGNELVMVMELADEQLLDRYNTCRAAGLRGVPRDELLGYMAEAAEALDVISERYGLQHLDVKPANLFVTAGHVKVGDYGLVSRLDAGGSDNRGLTPKYVAPEVLRGTVHLRSDQYSLALVYAELLTGAFPYPARTPQQMMLAHVSSTPDVSALPTCDQGPVFAALQKRPEDRFPTCREFVRAMADAVYVPAEEPPPPPAPPHAGRSTVLPRMTRVETTPAPGGEQTRPLSPPERRSGASAFVTPRPCGSGDGPRPGEVTRTGDGKTVPRLITPNSRFLTPGPQTPPPPAPDEDLPAAEPEGAPRVRVSPIRSVIPAGLLCGESQPRAAFTGEDFALAVVRGADGAGHVPQLPGDLGRTADGAWVCRFPSTVPPAVAALKLGVLKESWRVAVDVPEPGRIVLRRTAGGGGWFSAKKVGFEVTVAMPKPGKSSVCEVTLTGGVFGTPDHQFVQAAQDAIPRLLADVRRELGNVQDRRRSPRLAAAFPLTVHPLHSDGTADEPVRATCLDVSAGGAAFTTRGRLDTKYAYLEFDGVPVLAGLAVLVRVVRAVTPLASPDAVYGVQYRIDL
ncbi:protein kinase [bacterium]|nr:protein kinase [bacterium]